ncbi:MAG: D-glycero-beta-D-manno-heptose-7-phosphate kinase [Candidatus Sabulitectum sp.]|nr:D-glycero-beta-D-manno-heptose-7-phosphate kinase [Candidatus Sabulitectum sp.]
MIPDKDVQGLLDKFRGKKILVVGDLVLDHYLQGTVSRISPEAPVPVVALGDGCERKIPGGAANVALNVLSLGGKPVLAGVVGGDSDGDTLLRLLADAGVDVKAVVIDSGRPTTVKTRIMSKSQQLMRIDREKDFFLTREVEEALTSRIDPVMDDVSAVILEDYDKGVLAPSTIKHIIDAAVERKTHIAVDPKIRNFWEFAHCTLFKPNRHEAGIALGISIDSVEKAIGAAVELRKRLSAEAVLITLGSSGSVLVHGQGEQPQHLPTVARHVFDVSGAGDSVIAVMGLAGGSGVAVTDAAKLANLAAAAVCAEPGVYPVKPSDIIREASKFE